MICYIFKKSYWNEQIKLTQVLRNATGMRQRKAYLECKTGFYRGAILFLRLKTNIRYIVFLLL